MKILMVEDESGTREPIGIACNSAEAHELASDDLNRRKSALDAGEDPGLCPYLFIAATPLILAACEGILLALDSKAAEDPEVDYALEPIRAAIRAARGQA